MISSGDGAHELEVIGDDTSANEQKGSEFESSGSWTASFYSQQISSNWSAGARADIQLRPIKLEQAAAANR